MPTILEERPRLTGTLQAMDPLRVAYDHDRLVRQSAPSEPPGPVDGELETMSIGVFARRARLSMKALRLYERLGLLDARLVSTSSTATAAIAPASWRRRAWWRCCADWTCRWPSVADVVGGPARRRRAARRVLADRRTPRRVAARAGHALAHCGWPSERPAWTICSRSSERDGARAAGPDRAAPRAHRAAASCLDRQRNGPPGEVAPAATAGSPARCSRLPRRGQRGQRRAGRGLPADPAHAPVLD